MTPDHAIDTLQSSLAISRRTAQAFISGYLAEAEATRRTYYAVWDWHARKGVRAAHEEKRRI